MAREKGLPGLGPRRTLLGGQDEQARRQGWLPWLPSLNTLASQGKDPRQPASSAYLPSQSAFSALQAYISLSAWQCDSTFACIHSRSSLPYQTIIGAPSHSGPQTHPPTPSSAGSTLRRQQPSDGDPSRYWLSGRTQRFVRWRQSLEKGIGCIGKV